MAAYEKLLVKHLQSFSSKIESNFDHFKRTVEDNLSEIRSEVNKVTNKCSHLKGRIIKVENKIESFTPQLTEDTLAELNKRKRREVNVLAFNVTESKKTDGIERLAEDRAQLASIILPDIGVEVTSPKLRRIGRRVQGKTRPLLVETKSVSETKTLMKSKPDPSTQVVIRPDLTQAQQIHLKSISEELTSGNGKNNKTIKYINGTPRIVNKNFRQIKTKKKPESNSHLLPERKRAQN
ncbi:uncharacterized protein LOC141535007 [Cotesia typhae]|uniref:uncharacterized protein LOC141535007 n=1 Tax=Cotesia typhae TaxID=2053667 RepID=UPI003D69DA10